MPFLKRRRFFFFLTLLLLLLARSTPSHAAPDAVSAARSHAVSGGRFQKSKGIIRYRQKDGTYLKDTWASIKGRYYCFDANGRVRTRAFSWQGNAYYATSSGAIYTSKWRRTGSGSYYYGADGAMVKGTLKRIGTATYYFDKNGKMAKRKAVTAGDRFYYFGADGKLASSVPKVTGSTNKQDGIVLFVGASRVQQMETHVKAAGFAHVTDRQGQDWQTVYIARSGQGYQWFSRTALPQLKAYLRHYPRSKVILQLGNNDLNKTSSGNISSYIRQYRKLIRSYPKAQFYFMDALPSSKRALNARRVTFNKKLKKAFPKQYIGGYDYMIKAGYRTTSDGVHYTPDTSLMIFRYAMKRAEIY